MIPAFQSLPTKTDRRPTPPQIAAIPQVSGSLPRVLHLYHTEAEEHRQCSFGYEQNGANEIEANAIKWRLKKANTAADSERIASLGEKK
jgi:hypothetical protein